MKKTHRVNIYNKTLLFAGKSKAASKGEPRSRDRDCPPLMRPAQTARQTERKIKKKKIIIIIKKQGGEWEDQVEDDIMFIAIRCATDKRRSNG